ncbi:MAG: hypothetical protein M1819_001471 [Sarea resinae]|nr:MAG: hypothetical protein M1819_001471 [Sarea resinae]
MGGAHSNSRSNVNIPKYRCPRCSIRTCSLACSKRHKLWAQCSGVRDPAAYVKRSELATPSGIDRDFNFLTGIEQKLDNADKDAEERGLVTDGFQSHGRAGPRKGEVNVQKALERTRVIIERAPKGMSREKMNKTNWNKRQKCLSWTVEWIDGDGQSYLSNVLESSLLPQAYQRFLTEKQPSRKKRKLDTYGEPHTSSGPNTGTVEPAHSASGQPIAALDHADAVEDPSSGGASFKTDNTGLDKADTLDLPQRYFYLLRAHTTAPSRVLIPLSPTSSLSDCLRDQVVLEFPTIYALQQSPTSLPEGFILDSEYCGHANKQSQKLEDVLSKVAVPQDDATTTHEEQDPGNIMADERLIDVLRKDLGLIIDRYSTFNRFRSSGNLFDDIRYPTCTPKRHKTQLKIICRGS